MTEHGAVFSEVMGMRGTRGNDGFQMLRISLRNAAQLPPDLRDIFQGNSRL